MKRALYMLVVVTAALLVPTSTPASVLCHSAGGQVICVQATYSPSPTGASVWVGCESGAECPVETDGQYGAATAGFPVNGSCGSGTLSVCWGGLWIIARGENVPVSGPSHLLTADSNGVFVGDDGNGIQTGGNGVGVWVFGNRTCVYAQYPFIVTDC